MTASEEIERRIAEAVSRYWRRNLRLMGALLAIWFCAGPGCGILFADHLNRFHLGGYPLGFWFAQQGSILVFVVLILVYAISLNILDRRHGREIATIRARGAADS